MQITSPIPSDPLHPTYNVGNRDAQAEYLTTVKMTLRNCIKDIHFHMSISNKKSTERPHELAKMQSSVH